MSDRPTSRRRFLRAGVAGTSGVLLAGCSELWPGTRDASEEQADDAGGGSTTRVSDPDSETSDRIEANRTGRLVVTTRDENGDPVSDARVSVTMQAHAFDFGSSVDAYYLVDEAGPGGPYREQLRNLFNTAVVEHRNKWRPWEQSSERQYALDATTWLLSQGFRLRGHAVIWQRFDQPVVPKDVVAKVRSDDENRAAYVARRSREHVSDIVGHYAGDVAEWDVVNEQIHVHELTDVLNPDAPPTRAQALVEWFELAREAAGDATLYLNEHDVLTDDHPGVREDYETLARFLLNEGADLGGIGVQGHYKTPGETISPATVRERFDRYADLGLELKVTEYDTYGDEWTESEAATHLEQFLPAVFAHPATTGFLTWGFWDGAHWADNAPFFREDWSAKPACDVYRSLVFDEWWTTESGRTDSEGRFETSVFLGEHELVVSVAGESYVDRVLVTDPSRETAAEVRVSLG
ncbi:endo-1,4-beta-xylanase [Halobacterium zhouii]|uniref:endo-1,4-beta-xylanase n=1 Tax=Halobacterium zhouii TaxID=2902624 RepID=UPI001E6510FC|nr:endo-1,4-beta-xylanase [Halobacterium zhouii]